MNFFSRNIPFIILCTMLAHLHNPLLASQYPCEYSCTTNPLEEIYPNQNMCVLLESIPPALQNLPYVMYPCSDVYNTNRFGFNKRFNYFPAAIIVPTTEDELMYAFTALKENNVPFSVRSGGHCFGPGSLSNGYILDLRNFNTITPDTSTNTVFIGVGSHLGDVITTLGDLDYAIPTGTCPAVCVGGLALEGGTGYLARKWGLTCDSIMSIRMLNAQGAIIDIDHNNYPDLFWALCGAGANAFGIVIGFTFKMHYIPTVSLVSLQWDWNPKQAQKIFKTWQKWIKTLPKSITSECIFSYRTGTSRVTINALKVGSEPLTEWQCPFSKFNPTITNDYQGNYLQAATKIASTPTPPFSKVKSKFIFEPLSKKGIKVVTEFYSKLQEDAKNIRVNLFFGSMVHGAISKTHPHSSFFPRKAFAWVYEFGYWFYENQSAPTIALLNQFYHDLEPYTSPYSYANLVDYELGKDYLHAYYGDNVKRLIKTKRKYDPINIFTWKQGIPLHKL
ncbi:MAG TPA: FAD-binding oxidoreductase [Candidatus Babeliales bacterium]|nr:FAD-binding oxidoreductase [Candidatus Babeliales bacterium]